MTHEHHPHIRLLPKVSPRTIRHGAPWVYQNELVMDRRSRAITPGYIGILEDAARTPIAVVALNPISKITARILDLDPAAQIDRNWIEKRIQNAVALRNTLFDAPFYRLIHAEADGMPGVIIDRFGDVAVIQPNAAWAEHMLDLIADVLRQELGLMTLIKNASGRARAQEGLDDQSQIIFGPEPSAPIEVTMNGATYLADVVTGQKTGLFYDQRENHAFAARLARDKGCLDVFSHVGGFGLAALAGGARDVLAIDGAQAALTLAEAGALRMEKSQQFSCLKGDAFEKMDGLIAEGRLFDVVICDPPAFAPSKSALEAGLRAYERVARLGAKLTAPGGFLVLCSCSHAADLDKFRAASLRGIGRAGRQARLIHTGFAGPDHPTHPHLAQSAYLKALFFAL